MSFASEISVVSTDLGPIEFRRIGKGSPILYFHGGQSDARNETFDNVFDLTRYELIIPTRPGYGKTPLGHHKSPEDTARLVERLVDQLGLPAAALIGVSLGARAAIAFAALFPRRSRSLLLSAPVAGQWMTQKTGAEPWRTLFTIRQSRALRGP